MKLAILLAILLFPSIAGASSVISMDNLSAARNSTVVYPLVIIDAESLGAVQLKITFDPKVIRISSASGSGFQNFISNMDTSSLGYIALGAFDTSEKGIRGNIKLADIGIQAVGKEGESTPIKMEFSAWDVRGTRAPGYVVNNGSLKITGGLVGTETAPITPSVTLALPEETAQKRGEHTPVATSTAVSPATSPAAISVTSSQTESSAKGKEPPATKEIPGFWALEAAGLLTSAYALKRNSARKI